MAKLIKLKFKTKNHLKNNLLSKNKRKKMNSKATANLKFSKKKRKNHLQAHPPPKKNKKWIKKTMIPEIF
jgi:hypothetical protein